MTNIDQFYGKRSIETISDIGEWFNDLTDQFKLDCNPEDLSWCKDAKRCYSKLKRKGKQVDKIIKKESKVLIS